MLLWRIKHGASGHVSRAEGWDLVLDLKRPRLWYPRRPQNVITPPTVWHFKWIHPVHKGFFFFFYCMYSVPECWGAAPINRYTAIGLFKFATVRFTTKQKRITYKKSNALCCSWMLIIDPVSFNFSLNKRHIRSKFTRSELLERDINKIAFNRTNLHHK